MVAKLFSLAALFTFLLPNFTTALPTDTEFDGSQVHQITTFIRGNIPGKTYEKIIKNIQKAAGKNCLEFRETVDLFHRIDSDPNAIVRFTNIWRDEVLSSLEGYLYDDTDWFNNDECHPGNHPENHPGCQANNHPGYHADHHHHNHDECRPGNPENRPECEKHNDHDNHQNECRPGNPENRPECDKHNDHPDNQQDDRHDDNNLIEVNTRSLKSPVHLNIVRKNGDILKRIVYPPGTGENLPHYPPGTGENLPHYPPGTGENLPHYPPCTGQNLPFYPPGTGQNHC